MPDSGFGDERTVGRVVAVSNYKVTVLLDPESRSQVRSYPRNVAVITQLGGYLLFPVAPAIQAVAIIVGASEDEALEPDEHGAMTLQLTRARRVLRLNLLGQLKLGEPFIPGVSLYPTLDTPALLPTDEELKAILTYEPHQREHNRDIPIALGQSPIYGQPVTASYNDLLARPLAVVGNTGSGKSWSVAKLVQEAQKEVDEKGRPAQAKIIILDINGEYSTLTTGTPEPRELNHAYINGKQFQVPLWAFNLTELIAFFDAAQQSQVPVLERVVTEIRESSIDATQGQTMRTIVRRIDDCLSYLDSLNLLLDSPVGMYCGDNLRKLFPHVRDTLAHIRTQQITGYVYGTSILSTATLEAQLPSVEQHYIPVNAVNVFRPGLETLRHDLHDARATAIRTGGLKQVTADTPIPFACKLLLADEFFAGAIARFRGQERIQEYLATLRLRIHRQLTDKRWNVFTADHTTDIARLMNTILGETANVSVIDCSMLAHDVLPVFCAIIGRLLLDLRTRAEPDQRTTQPYVLVLEEAHNYLRPQRHDETAGIRLARDTFERIAKEGRKFGLSLIIASQRPADVSGTVLSQCANFLIHRIQNPEDIDYFKKILPLGSRDLLEQLPILAPGDGLLLGSAVNVPARMKVQRPNPSPASETSRPWEAWQPTKPPFNIEAAIKRWMADTILTQERALENDPPVAANEAQAVQATEEQSTEAGPNTHYEATDEDVPF